MSRPSDICLTLAAVDSWLSGDEVRGRLERLGFEDLTAQSVAIALLRLSRMDAPPIEARREPWSGHYWEFRTTVFGRTWLGNRVRWTREWR